MVDQYVGPAETLHDEIEKLLRSVFLCHVRSKNGMIAAQFRSQHLASVLWPCDQDELTACVAQPTRSGCAYTGFIDLDERAFIMQCCTFCIRSSCSTDSPKN